MSTEKLQNALSAVPFLNATRVIVKHATPGAVTLTLNDSGELRDHANHIHSGVLFTLGEAAAGIALGTHPDLAGLQQLQHASGVRYLKPCPSVPLAVAKVGPADIQQLQADLAANGHGKMEVVVGIQDAQGLQLAEVVSVFSIRQPVR